MYTPHRLKKKCIDDLCTECTADNVAKEVDVLAIAACSDCQLRLCGMHYFFYNVKKR